MLFRLSPVFLTPLLLAVCALPTKAQTAEAARERRVNVAANRTPTPALPPVPKILTSAELVLDKPLPTVKLNATSKIKSASQQRFERLLLSAINGRLGAPYHYGSTGPDSFDCSGFVWSAFQAAGVNFERMSAHDLWQMSVPAREGEERQFGTLVFFNNLHHVGIVADEKGFYHASTSQGVTYSLFEGYWEKRIVGFRRLPIALPVVNE
jgi:cell wall-associated NlpC family hydrolase